MHFVSQHIIDWLLKGDISIQYQTYRDLLSQDRKDFQKRISTEGFGSWFIENRQPSGNWGQSFYQPKWISTHYTLMDLRNLNLYPDNDVVRNCIRMIIEKGKAEDGGIPLGPSTQKHSDVCVNGMFLNYASYFKTEPKDLHSVIDSILKELMPDGGFNCRSNRSGAIHSSLHTTLSVLEGFTSYLYNDYSYRKEDVLKAITSAKEFILLHQLFLSDRTGDIIDKRFLKFSYPRRWCYDILSALDYFQYSKTPWDNRMSPAIRMLLKKRNKNGTWNVQAKHPGKTHFDMERAGHPSRWNTLRALRVLNHFNLP